MKIGMILDTPRSFPPDIRVEKEALALINAGFKVSLLAKVSVEKKLQYEEYKGISIRREYVNDKSYIYNKINMVKLIKTEWVEAINSFIIRFRPDILHVHDLIILPTVIKVANKYKIPVVADLHENMPAASQNLYINKKMIKRLIGKILYHILLYHERRALPKCTRIIVVTKEAKNRLQKKHKIVSSKIVIVSNTESKSFIPRKYDKKIINKYKNYFVGLYHGGIGPHRGVDIIVKAIPLIVDKIPNYRLLIIGVTDEKQKHYLENINKNTKYNEYMELIKWTKLNVVKTYIYISNFGIVPHLYLEHTNTTVPHKFFQYMIMRKPTITSDCIPLKRIVLSTQSGTVFRSGDEKDFAEKVITLFIKYKEYPSEYNKMCNNAFKAASGNYSWDNDVKRLINIYKI